MRADVFITSKNKFYGLTADATKLSRTRKCFRPTAWGQAAHPDRAANQRVTRELGCAGNGSANHIFGELFQVMIR